VGQGIAGEQARGTGDPWIGDVHGDKYHREPLRPGECRQRDGAEPTGENLH